MSTVVADRRKIPVGKIIGCGCSVLFVAVVAVVAAVLVGAFALLKKSQPYADSVDAVQSSPAAVEALGEPIKPGFFVSGNISLENDSGTANFNIPVSGPEGKGSIHVEGTKSASRWTYQVWELRVDGKTDPIPLGN